METLTEIYMYLSLFALVGVLRFLKEWNSSSLPLLTGPLPERIKTRINKPVRRTPVPVYSKKKSLGAKQTPWRAENKPIDPRPFLTLPIK